MCYFSQKSIDYFCKQKGLIVNQCWLNGIPIELKDYPNIMSYKLHYIRYFNIAIINLSKEAIVSMSPAKEKACMQSILETLSQLPSLEKDLSTAQLILVTINFLRFLSRLTTHKTLLLSSPKL